MAFLTRTGDVALALGRPLTVAEDRVTEHGRFQLCSNLIKSSALQLGPELLRFKRCPDGGFPAFVMMRRGSTADTCMPRFGIFEGAFLHVGLDNRQRMFVQVKWHKVSPQLYHPLIRAPMAMTAIDTAMPKLCLAERIAPFVCFGAPDLEHPRTRLIMLKDKNWSCLSLLGFPEMP